jgi:HAD superfamily hydrolase (TIGR01450 family)
VAWILDLDGVVWLADQPIAGAVHAVARLRGAGERVLFLTNNSSARVGDYLAKLEALDIPAAATDLLTSAQAAARLLEPDSRALVCAGPGVDEALRARGVDTVREGDADAVVVGWHTDFDYARLTAAFRAVHRGARLIGTNDDATYPVPGGLLPGGGSILAAVATASGVAPEIAGKPHPPMAELVRARIGTGELARSILVGDRLSTDGLMASRLGVPFALLLSGVTTPADAPYVPEPTWVADELAALVDTIAQLST